MTLSGTLVFSQCASVTKREARGPDSLSTREVVRSFRWVGQTQARGSTCASQVSGLSGVLLATSFISPWLNSIGLRR